MSTVTTLASTPIGDVVTADGMVYVLTACCGASGKGGATSVVCRKCYATVGEVHARGWELHSERFVGTDELAALLRPSCKQYADAIAERAFARAVELNG